jgi:hypothetical protein
MITEPLNGWAKNALQEFETLYIGGAEPAVVRRAFVGYELAEQDLAKSRLGQIKMMRDCEGKFNDHDGSGTGLLGTSTRLNDE